MSEPLIACADCGKWIDPERTACVDEGYICCGCFDEHRSRKETMKPFDLEKDGAQARRIGELEGMGSK